ncbi:alanine/glycine:cation symporter family protein [Marinobacterium arenosum]|uniref:alanine/glycine:cation symporter family protein n=1 Tax=Marinobacterium arenosum TaxID=2862496 RepID=UPI001C94CACC|nr:alanine/glycine:cation symporter family protein [Marinobacterium arenosum]MBY4677363.1 alanine:cation symporter family protein [Marinobacterium arenosum]
MEALINFLNGLLWGQLLVPLLLGVGLLFTVRLKLLQLRKFSHMFGVLAHSRQEDINGISPFQALCTSLASRVGTGNLAGVAVAIYLGGAGAVFWMWMTALLGMATGYAESCLAQLYKVKDDSGTYRGGPAYYIERGLGQRWLGMLFALLLILSFGFVFNAVQANSIASAMETAFGFDTQWTGVVIALLAGLVIFGGVRSIARVAEMVVPLMALIYLLIALAILVMNIDQVPAVFGNIIDSAFGLNQAAGGIAGGLMAAMMNGVKRGLFSNEAGMGSAPNAAATASPTPHHPASQGFMQALGVFIDTVVICSCTAFIILVSGVFEPGNGVSGVELTQLALDQTLGGVGKYLVAIAILFFAFTSIIGNYMYAENNVVYLLRDRPTRLVLNLVRSAVLAMVLWGAMEKVGVVWDAADASMGLMALVNLVALLLLSGVVVKLTRDYEAQQSQGLVPHFDLRRVPLPGRVDRSIWGHPAPSVPYNGVVAGQAKQADKVGA